MEHTRQMSSASVVPSTSMIPLGLGHFSVVEELAVWSGNTNSVLFRYAAIAS